MIEPKVREILIEQECTFDEAIKRIACFAETLMIDGYINGHGIGYETGYEAGLVYAVNNVVKEC